MKNYGFQFVAGLFITALVAFSCAKDKTEVSSELVEVQTTTDGQLYRVDTLNSKIEWTGYKVFKSDNTSHYGNIKFESGDVTVKDGKLESGKFVADLTTLSNEDLKDDPEQMGKLTGHLKSADFFDVEKFPTASYEITRVKDAQPGSDYNTILEGNLTIKGITKPESFNANVTVQNGVVSIATEPKEILRENYGVKFQMPLDNGLIKNEIQLQMLIKALEQK